MDVRIPWKQLGKEPVEVVLDCIHIVVEPHFEKQTLSSDAVDASRHRELLAKRSKIAAVELLAAKLLNLSPNRTKGGKQDGQSEGKKGFGSSLQDWAIDK